MTWLSVMLDSAFRGVALCLLASGMIEVLDAEDAVKAFLPTLDSTMGSGLVTLGKVQALQYGADVKRAPA
jgi:hypothetical protein